MGAEWQHIDLSNGYLRIPAELRKGRKRDRIYRLAGDTVAAIDKIKTPERRLIFPWPFHDTYLWTKYGRILKQLNLPNDRKSKFHRMRRSVASHFEAGGGDAMALLGHSQRRVTEGYLDPRIVGEKHAIDVLFRPVPHWLAPSASRLSHSLVLSPAAIAAASHRDHCSSGTLIDLILVGPDPLKLCRPPPCLRGFFRCFVGVLLIQPSYRR